MILEQHIPHYERLRQLGAYRSPMLMLGNQESHVGDPAEFFGVEDYRTLDPDGGTYQADLNYWWGFSPKFRTVFNLGTLEHVWDARVAWSVALSVVHVNGVFITVSPVGGWENHGIHITNAKFIRLFIEQNGFAVMDAWLTRANGEEISSVERGGGDQLLWLAATKLHEVKHFRAPQQIFKDGAPLERIGT